MEDMFQVDKPMRVIIDNHKNSVFNDEVEETKDTAGMKNTNSSKKPKRDEIISQLTLNANIQNELEKMP